MNYLNICERNSINQVTIFNGKEKEKNENTSEKSEESINYNAEKEFNEEEEEGNENSNLIQNIKLSKILKNISNKLDKDNNKRKKLEEIYETYNKKDEDKEIIKEDNSNSLNYFMYFFVAGLFVFVNLLGIFTIRGIMNSLYEIFKISIQYFLYKKSELEKYGLTDFESLYNSSYNFYEQYFNDISNNEVDFDLMMFWDFFGSLFYEYFNFGCTAIFFFILNIILLAFIGGFDFLDIDEKTHKYSFFQILYISLVYFFLWITVGSSALLSQQVYIDSFEILKKKKERKRKRKKKERRRK